MIKSEIIKKEEPIKPFPKLMINVDYNIIIIATKNDEKYFTGMAVYSEGKIHKTGHYSTNWVDFKDYNGTVTLSNSQ